MRKDHAAILFVLDETGSMGGKEQEVQSAWAKFLGEQRALPGTAELWLLRFDSSRELEPTRYEDLKVVPDELHYRPGAMTPLYDAVGTMIDRAGRDFSERDEGARPAKVVCVVLTDGLENASGEYTAEKVREAVRRQREEWAWEFEFLGVGIDAWAAGSFMNLPKDRYTNTVTPQAAGLVASARVSSYRSAM